MYAVNLYFVDRAFGGREEGGWYYDYGQPELHPLNRVFEHREDAEDYVISLQDYEEELNQGRPSIDSVLSQGQYRFIIGAKDALPAPFPTERPRYE
jgi:hypothetical protein